jgi:hypothetical protein
VYPRYQQGECATGLQKATEHEIHEKNAKLGHDQMTAHLDGYFAIQGMVGAMANNMMAFSKLVISECVDPLANFSKEGTSTCLFVIFELFCIDFFFWLLAFGFGCWLLVSGKLAHYSCNLHFLVIPQPRKND